MICLYLSYIIYLHSIDLSSKWKHCCQIATEIAKKIWTLLANSQRNSLSIVCRHNSACYIAEVFTFIALLLISCDSLALSHQTTCFYIDKNFISDCLETTTSCSYAMQGTTWAICLLVVHRDYSVSWSSKWIEKKINFIDLFMYV